MAGTTPDRPADTTYHVLKDTGRDADYQLVAQNIPARSAREAIRTFADADREREGGVLEGTYIAIPARSWKPVKVSAETKTTIKFA